MNRAAMLSELREVLDDVYVPFSWTDSTLLGGLSEGQDKFCEETGYFTDIANFTLTLQTDIAIYAIPDRIIQLVDIWDGTRKLTKIRVGEVYSAGDAEPSGVPTHWRTDQATGFINLYPTPTSEENGDILVLQVWRYSQDDLADDSIEPEIPGRFRRACIEWAAHKALEHFGTDKQSHTKAMGHLRSFGNYVLAGKTALERIQNQEVYIGTAPEYRT